jgi:hypothetical protein
MMYQDPTRSGKYGRPAVLAVMLEIDLEQASVINRKFTLYAEGKADIGQ